MDQSGANESLFSRLRSLRVAEERQAEIQIDAELHRLKLMWQKNAEELKDVEEELKEVEERLEKLDA